MAGPSALHWAFTSSDPDLVIAASVAGLGLCCLPDWHLQPWIDRGELVPVLEDWCPAFPGYHLYYPSRLQTSPAFSLLVGKLRWRE